MNELLFRKKVNCNGGASQSVQSTSGTVVALVEAVTLRTRDTPYPWLMACDATLLYKGSGSVREP